MLKSLFLTGLLLFLTTAPLAAQQFILSENETDLAQELCFCQPGVYNKSRGKGAGIQFGFYGNQSFRYQKDGTSYVGQSDQRTELTAKIKIPLVNAERTKLLLGYEYHTELFHLREYSSAADSYLTSLHDHPLKSNKFSVYLTQAVDYNMYVALRGRVAFNAGGSGWSTIHKDSDIYSSALVVGYKPDNRHEYGVGLLYNHNFFNQRLLPFIVYNHTFNERWGMETVLPVKLSGRRNFSDDSILLFGADFTSRNYATLLAARPEQERQRMYFRHTAVNIGASWQRRLNGWVWAMAETGLQIPMNMAIADGNHSDIILQDISRGYQPYVRMGIFISPAEN